MIRLTGFCTRVNHSLTLVYSNELGGQNGASVVLNPFHTLKQTNSLHETENIISMCFQSRMQAVMHCAVNIVSLTMGSESSDQSLKRKLVAQW